MSRASIPSSFRDPSGFLFRHDSTLYRQVNPVYAANYDAYVNAGGGPTDLGGAPVPVDDPDTTDTGSGAVTYQDIGAHEYQIICSGDLDGDGVVNAADLATLLGGWGPCGVAGCPADLNSDGDVNAADLAILLGAWGACV